jgi:hypothetical protein
LLIYADLINVNGLIALLLLVILVSEPHCHVYDLFFLLIGYYITTSGTRRFGVITFPLDSIGGKSYIWGDFYPCFSALVIGIQTLRIACHLVFKSMQQAHLLVFIFQSLLDIQEKQCWFGNSCNCQRLWLPREANIVVTHDLVPAVGYYQPFV